MSGEGMKVSVVGSYYKRAQLVSESVGALLACDYKPVEFVIVDDGSTDNTLSELLKFDDPRLKVVAQANLGFNAAIRRAISMSDGEFISIHASGDWQDPSLIGRQAEILLSYPEIGWVGCRYRNITANGRVSSLPAGDTTGDLTQRLVRDPNPFCSGGSMFRRTLYDEVGGFRPFFMYALDIDLWLRLSERARFYVIDDELVERKKLTGGVSMDYDKLTWQRFLSAFAKYCAEERRRTGIDPLDEFGPTAFLQRSKSKRLAGELVRMAQRALEVGDHGWARWLAALSLKEQWSLRGLEVLLASRLGVPASAYRSVRIRRSVAQKRIAGMLVER